MRKPHALAVSLMIGAATVAGVFALNRTVSLGQTASTPTPTTTIAARQAALDRAEAQIAKLRASRPPALPDRPTAVSAPTPRVVYVRAPQPPAVSGGGEREAEGEHGEEGWDD
jgi:hypothetical protein